MPFKEPQLTNGEHNLKPKSSVHDIRTSLPQQLFFFPSTFFVSIKLCSVSANRRECGRRIVLENFIPKANFILEPQEAKKDVQVYYKSEGEISQLGESYLSCAFLSLQS
jgi:hypothetical protein